MRTPLDNERLCRERHPSPLPGLDWENCFRSCYGLRHGLNSVAAAQQVFLATVLPVRSERGAVSRGHCGRLRVRRRLRRSDAHNLRRPEPVPLSVRYGSGVTVGRAGCLRLRSGLGRSCTDDRSTAEAVPLAVRIDCPGCCLRNAPLRIRRGICLRRGRVSRTISRAVS